MSAEFTEAPTITAGDKPTAAQWNTLAAAFNDRLASGIGDPTWRVHYKAMALLREFRSASGPATPAQDEFFNIYLNVEPDQGSPDGTLSWDSPIVQMVLGNNAGYLAEYERLNRIPAGTGTWEDGKAQRGAWAWQYEAGPNMNAPVFEVARDYAAHGHPWIYGYTQTLAYGAPMQNTRKYNSTWGGFIGVPSGYYDSFYDEVYYLVKFSHLDGGTDLTISTQSVAHGGNGLVSVYRLPDRYILEYADTTTVELPFRTYVEGPYEYAGVNRVDADTLDQTVSAVANKFHGSDTQREVDSAYRVADISFDFQSFLSRQYQLAPARGHMDGAVIVADYPEFTFTGPLAADSTAAGSSTFLSPFSFCGFSVVVTGTLTTPIRVQFLDDGSPIIAEDTHVISGSIVHWFTDAALYGYRPELTVKVLDAVPAGVTITVECAELVTMRPGYEDAYVILRRVTTTGNSGDVDTTGATCATARAVSDALLATGSLSMTEDVPQPVGLDESPWYQGMREMVRDHLRMVKRDSLVSYTAGAQAVLYFDRTVSVGAEDIDLWHGIAPPLEAIQSGQVMSGVVYSVRGATGAVTYNGTAYAIGAQFTGAVGVTGYTATGTAAPHQVDGIIATAPASGWDNRWLMFMSFATYNSGAFQLDDYADPLAWLTNRCLFGSGELADDAELDAHFEGGLATRPIAPSSMNYVQQFNRPLTDKEDFYQSCRIYPADYSVASVRCEDEGGNYSATRVRVQLATGLTPDANGERSDDNAITDYIAFDQSLTDCPVRVGDAATGETPTNGQCIPRFYFTRLVPTVYTGTADGVQQSTDTRMQSEPLQWCRWLLDAMCEGYLDRRNNDGGCLRRPVYTFETLCHAALGDRRFPNIGGDRSFGPMSSEYILTHHFNDISACVNLLTRVPVELPYALEERSKTTGGERELTSVTTGDDGNFGEYAISEVGTASGTYREQPDSNDPQLPDRGDVTDFTLAAGSYTTDGTSDTGWSAWTEIDYGDPPTASISCPGVKSTAYVLDVPYMLPSFQTRTELRWNTAHPAFLAIPSSLYGCISLEGGLTLLIQDQEIWHTNDNPDPVLIYAPSFYWPTGVYLEHTSTTYRCVTVPVDTAFFDGSGSIELTPRPLQPSTVGTFVDDSVPRIRAFGPSSYAAVIGNGYIVAEVPLV